MSFEKFSSGIAMRLLDTRSSLTDRIDKSPTDPKTDYRRFPEFHQWIKMDEKSKIRFSMAIVDPFLTYVRLGALIYLNQLPELIKFGTQREVIELLPKKIIPEENKFLLTAECGRNLYPNTGIFCPETAYWPPLSSSLSVPFSENRTTMLIVFLYRKEYETKTVGNFYPPYDPKFPEKDNSMAGLVLVYYLGSYGNLLRDTSGKLKASKPLQRISQALSLQSRKSGELRKE